MGKGKRRASRVKQMKAIDEDIREDGIIVSILSSLSMIEAVRTSILSSRWRYLWTCIPNLYFSDFHIFETEAVGISKLSIPEQGSFMEERTAKFIRRVNEILQHHQGVGVQKFKLKFFLHKKHTDHLDRWTRFAIASGAKDLFLSLSNVYSSFCQAMPYELDCQLFAGGRGSSLEHIHLQSCSLSMPPNFEGFISLKTLYLCSVNVDDSDIQVLLSTSPLLETLVVRQSNGLVNLKINHRQLKHLTVEVCRQLRDIEFSCVNLTIFEYSGPRVSLRGRSAAQLTWAYIRIYEVVDAMDYYCTGLPHDLPHLNTLFFYFNKDYEKVNLPENVNKFAHLKHLVVFVRGKWAQDLLWLSSILNAAPLLEKFEVHFFFTKNLPEERRVISRPSKCSHDHLKTIEISGFSGTVSEIEIAIYMLNNAIALDTMTIWASKKFYEGNGKFSCSCATLTAQESLRSVASKYLHGEVPSGSKLRIE